LAVNSRGSESAVHTQRRGRIEDEPVATQKPAEPAQAPLHLGVSADSSLLVARLALTEPMARAGAVHSLHAGAGNHAVGTMLQRHRAASEIRRPVSSPASPRSGPTGGTFVMSRPFEVSLGVGPTTPSPMPALGAGASPDGKYSHNPTPPEAIPVAGEPAAAGPAAASSAAATEPGGAAPAAAEPAPAAQAPAADAEGVTISLPDVIKPELAFVQVCDSIAGEVPYSATIANTATPGPTQFGICRFGDVKVTGITAKLEKGIYQVRGMLENTITWGVHPTTDNETDIASATDPDITAANYTTVADDLKPNMSSSGGRPPRSKFWAKDLTETHELFHANDVKRLGPGAATAAVSWLSQKTATDAAGVQALVDQLPARVVQTLAAGMGEPSEVRSYGSGAAAYTTRSDEIRKSGKAGNYK
jgi:hypothetical protein